MNPHATKKGPQPLSRLPAAIYLPAATVETPVGRFAATVQPPIDAIAFAIEALRQTLVPGCIRASRLAIEVTVDPVAAIVEALFDAIAFVIETLLDAVAGVGERRAGAKQQPCRDDDTFPYVHDPLRG